VDNEGHLFINIQSVDHHFGGGSIHKKTRMRERKANVVETSILELRGMTIEMRGGGRGGRDNAA